MLLQKARAVLGDVRLSPPSENTDPTQKHKDKLPRDVYGRLLERVREENNTIRHWDSRPYPPGAQVLSPYGTSVSSFHKKDRVFTIHKAHPGNSSVLLRTPHDVLAWGFIESIWICTINSRIRTFCNVRCHCPLSPSDQLKSPYNNRPLLQADVVYSGPGGQQVLIEPTDIIAHATYRLRDPGVFGIAAATLVVVSTDRGRSGIIS
jgi:hypothetical protein